MFTRFLILIMIFGSCSSAQKSITHNSTKKSDEALLKSQFDQIQNLSNSVSCSNSSEWKFTPLGSKACGGPTQYIAYSIKIDTTEFLNLVKTFTENQKEYNKKWNIISDCMMQMPPKEIVCENGKPQLYYETIISN